MQENTCIEDDSSNKKLFKFHFTVEMDLGDVLYYLNVCQTGISFAKFYNECVVSAEPLLCFNMIDFGALRHLHQHQLL